MSISLLSSAYLEENSARIRSKLVPWEGYQRAELITSEELAYIKKIDRQPKPKCEAVLLSEGRTYAVLYLSLLKKLQRVDTMQYLLILITDALQDHDERILLFLRASEEDPDLPYAPLLRALETQDEFVQLKAAQILTVFLRSVEIYNVSNRCYLVPIQGKKSGEHLTSSLGKYNASSGVPRVLIGVYSFIDILKRNPGPQMSYQVAFCFWLLSFEQNISEQINKKYDVIPVLVEVAQNAVKEKVIRVIVATFRNLVSKAPAENLPAMLVCQVLPFVKNLAGRKWSDEDIIEDVTFLRDELNARFQSLTTYDEYVSELASGHLSWSPVHESDDFWKENATRLNENDYEQLKILIKLLKESADPLVLAVAAHDIGQYVKHYERGKKPVADLSGKTRVMELMTHPNSDVRYHALLSVQQLVSQPWVTV
ncbi:hypothetical protein CVT26_002781 [Gymnopilus dilepis]|uniref:V-type proton ATPase subunit H n=1 Tax=Gymnopilus dilepis TaxID=231916 RepID=A0A409VC92_9AGAR|nr:hypothetical protein CVT26_002781 [Gymnopilus dilepis]